MLLVMRGTQAFKYNGSIDLERNVFGTMQSALQAFLLFQLTAFQCTAQTDPEPKPHTVCHTLVI